MDVRDDSTNLKYEVNNMIISSMSITIYNYF